MYVLVLHPWRETPSGELSIVADPAVPSLHLVKLSDKSGTEPRDPADVAEVVGAFTLSRSPDPRAPEVAVTVADVLAEAWPAWLERRLLELLNNIGGLGRARSAGNYRAAMRTMDRGAPDALDHPLAPLGVWGPFVEQVTREVRKGRLSSWEEATKRLDPALVQSIQDAVPGVLRDDLLGRVPRMLMKERL